MKSKIDLIFEDILGRKKSIPTLFTDNPKENIKILAELMPTVNLAKCTLFDLDIEEPNSVMYLTYLLQKESIPFGICKNVKVFRKNETIVVKCEGGLNCPCKGKYFIL